MKKLNKKLLALLSCTVLTVSPLAYAEGDASLAAIGGADGPSSLVLASGTDQGFTVQVEKEVLGSQAQPLIIEGRSFLPFRVLFGAMGAEVDYDAAAKTISAQLDDMDILLTIGSKTATVNDEAVSLLSAPIISNSTTYIPVRDVANITGREVEYSASQKKVNVYDVDKLIADMDSNFTIYNQILQNSSADQMNKTYKSTVNLIGDIELYNIEDGTKKFSGEINFDGLTKGMDLNGTFDVKVNLKDFDKSFSSLGATAEDLQMLKDVLASKHQVIMDGKKSIVYIKSDALSNIMDLEKGSWLKFNGGDSLGNLSALYMGQLNHLLNNPQEATMGKILYETSKAQQETLAAQGLADFMPSLYDQMEMSSRALQFMMGDDGFAKTGSTYTMALNKDSIKTRIAKFFPEAVGELNSTFADVENLNYKMVLTNVDSKNPNIEWKIDGKVKDASQGTISFDMSIIGKGNTDSTITMNLTLPKYGKFKLDMKSKSSETNQSINLTPPQGAKIETII